MIGLIAFICICIAALIILVALIGYYIWEEKKNGRNW